MGPARFEVFAQRLGGAGGHVRQELLAQFGAPPPLSATMSVFRCHLAQHRLDGPVVQFEDVLEHEHLVHDLLGQVGVVAADGSRAPRCPCCRAQHVDDLGRRLDAAASELLRILSPPASTLKSTSFRSFSAVGWMPSRVATRSSTSLRWRVGELHQDRGGLVGIQDAPGWPRRSAGVHCAGSSATERGGSNSTSELSRCPRRPRPAECGRSAARPCRRPSRALEHMRAT